MPYVKVDPDAFLQHNGVDVYYVYVESAPFKYWFTTKPDNADDFCGHGRDGQFDVRRLTGLWDSTPTVQQWDDWWKPRHSSELGAMEALVEAAIESKSPVILGSQKT